jgi:hypothetical protein
MTSITLPPRATRNSSSGAAADDLTDESPDRRYLPWPRAQAMGGSGAVGISL